MKENKFTKILNGVIAGLGYVTITLLLLLLIKILAVAIFK
jgi:hypothetical protein